MDGLGELLRVVVERGATGLLGGVLLAHLTQNLLQRVRAAEEYADLIARVRIARVLEDLVPIRTAKVRELLGLEPGHEIVARLLVHKLLEHLELRGVLTATHSTQVLVRFDDVVRVHGRDLVHGLFEPTERLLSTRDPMEVELLDAERVWVAHVLAVHAAVFLPKVHNVLEDGGERSHTNATTHTDDRLVTVVVLRGSADRAVQVHIRVLGLVLVAVCNHTVQRCSPITSVANVDADVVVTRGRGDRERMPLVRRDHRHVDEEVHTRAVHESTGLFHEQSAGTIQFHGLHDTHGRGKGLGVTVAALNEVDEEGRCDVDVRGSTSQPRHGPVEAQHKQERAEQHVRVPEQVELALAELGNSSEREGDGRDEQKNHTRPDGQLLQHRRKGRQAIGKGSDVASHENRAADLIRGGVEVKADLVTHVGARVDEPSSEQNGAADLVELDVVIERDVLPHEMTALEHLRDGAAHGQQHEHTVEHGHLSVGTSDTETPTDGRVHVVREPLAPERGVVHEEVEEQPPDAQLVGVVPAVELAFTRHSRLRRVDLLLGLHVVGAADVRVKHALELVVLHAAVLDTGLAEQKLGHGLEVRAHDIDLGRGKVGRQQLHDLVLVDVAALVGVHRVEDEAQLVFHAHVELHHSVDQNGVTVDHAVVVVVALIFAVLDFKRLGERRAVDHTVLVGHRGHDVAQRMQLGHGIELLALQRAIALAVLRQRDVVLGLVDAAVAENGHRHDVARGQFAAERRLVGRRHVGDAREAVVDHGRSDHGVHVRSAASAAVGARDSMATGRAHDRGGRVAHGHERLAAHEACLTSAAAVATTTDRRQVGDAVGLGHEPLVRVLRRGHVEEGLAVAGRVVHVHGRVGDQPGVRHLLLLLAVHPLVRSRARWNVSPTQREPKCWAGGRERASIETR